MNIEVVKVQSKKNGQTYEALKLTVGDFTKLIFLNKYELFYLKDQIKTIKIQNGQNPEA